MFRGFSRALDVDSSHSSAPKMRISDRVRDCLEFFRKLKDILDSSEDAKAKTPNADLILSDELGRFSIWSSNIGAHRLGESSLDYRLRDASHLKSHVLLLPKSLIDSLHDGKAIAFRWSFSFHSVYLFLPFIVRIWIAT